MASIERTAYPRLKHALTAAELADVYSLTPAELALTDVWARGPAPRLAFAILLKTFQRLGYFPSLGDVPAAIVDHLRSALGLSRTIAPTVTPRTLYKYHQAIRNHLGVRPYGPDVLQLAARVLSEAAKVKDHPADLINVAIEELVRERCELPGFTTLDRLARRIRSVVNHRLYRRVYARLTELDMLGLELLRLAHEPNKASSYAVLKQPARRATLGNLQDLLDRLTMVTALGDASKILAGVPPAKIAHFAAEANALDSAELHAYGEPRRYTLLLSLIYRAQRRIRDDLAEMAIKRINAIHKRGREELERLRAEQQATVERLMRVLGHVLTALSPEASNAQAGKAVRRVVERLGGPAQLLEECEAALAAVGDNHLPLLWRFYRSHRKTLFRLVRALEFESASQDQALVLALDVVRDHEHKRGDWLETNVDLSFASEAWQRLLVTPGPSGEPLVWRRHFEVCVFSYLAAELRSGDLAIKGSAEFADYREQLLEWTDCEPMIPAYCREVGLPASADAFVDGLRTWLAETAREVDAGYPSNGQLVIGPNGEPTLKRIERREPAPSAIALEKQILERLPERSLIEILCDVEHWTGWTRHFGPLSGSEPKLERARERYVLTAFTYGCNLGPAQAARHMDSMVSAHQLSFVNRRHIDGQRLDRALRDVINTYSRLELPKLWGDGTRAAADGTKYDLYEENLLSEYHIRYGGYGGIAYHHVADSYVALFSHFIPCGVWEAIYIIEGLLKNRSDIQPDTIHADTQGQSAPVFALAYLLGIKLMPRIRNWKALTLYRPARGETYEHIDALFGDAVDWERIRTHWQDLMQVALSIRAGKVSSPTLLRKLGNYSRKNRLYQAFREVGRVVRTAFLLRYISDRELREQITATTNKVEAYNGFAKWIFFGGEGVIAENDPEEQEKRIKYNDLVANAAVLHTAVDVTTAVRELRAAGVPTQLDDLRAMSPYITRTIKRFGDYVIDLDKKPAPLNGALMPKRGARRKAASGRSTKH